MEEKTEQVIKEMIASVVMITVGSYSLVNHSNRLGGAILVVLGVLVSGIDPEVRNFLFSIWKWLTRKSDSQVKTDLTMTSSPHGMQQSAGRDIINLTIKTKEDRDESVSKIASLSPDIRNFIDQERSSLDSSGRERIRLREENALDRIYKKMLDALEITNLVGNTGVKDSETFQKVSHSIDNFIRAKKSAEIHILDDKIITKLNEVMGSFRKARGELFNNFRDKKFNFPLSVESFDFIKKCGEATILIKQNLNQIPENN